MSLLFGDDDSSTIATATNSIQLPPASVAGVEHVAAQVRDLVHQAADGVQRIDKLML